MSWVNSRLSAATPQVVEPLPIQSNDVDNEDALILQEEQRYAGAMAAEARKGDVYRRLMSSWKSFNSATAGDVNGLYAMTVGTLVLYLGLAVTFFAIWAAVDTKATDINLKYVYFSRYTYQLNDAFKVNFTLAAAIGCLLPMLGALFDVLTWASVKTTSLRCRTNWIRWFVDSLFTPYLTVLGLMLIGQGEILTLLLQFVTVHAAVACGGLTELVNSPWSMSSRKSAVSWWPFVFSLWLGVASLLPAIILLATSKDLTHLSPISIAGFTLLIASWAVQSYIQFSYYGWLSMPTSGRMYSRDSGPINNYVRYESWISIVNVLFRTTVVVLVAFAYTSNTDWVRDHVCAWTDLDIGLDQIASLDKSICFLANGALRSVTAPFT